MTILIEKGCTEIELPCSYNYCFGEARFYAISYKPQVWEVSKVYIKGQELILPTVDNGFMYDCVSSGISGLIEPVFSTVESEETEDNTVIWRAKPYNLLLNLGDTVNSSVWEGIAEVYSGGVTTYDSNITLDSEAIVVNRQAIVRLVSVPVDTVKVRLTNTLTLTLASGGTETYKTTIVITIGT